MKLNSFFFLSTLINNPKAKDNICIIHMHACLARPSTLTFFVSLRLPICKSSKNDHGIIIQCSESHAQQAN